MNISNVVFVDDNAQKQIMDPTAIKSLESNDSQNEESKCNNEGSDKQSAVWTTNATLTLLKCYETKLEMLETPKKKTRIWIAISEHLKEHDIEVTPDQVRWKINALAKKYKQCIETGKHIKFRFFKEMDDIYSQYNVECTDYSILNADRFERMKFVQKNMLENPQKGNKSSQESKALIELRKIRLADRLDADRTQSKICLEKQWLEYLSRQEEQKQWHDEIFERSLKLREEELELRRKELEMKESLELRKIEIKERDQEEMLRVEREKCELLKRLFSQHSNHYT